MLSRPARQARFLACAGSLRTPVPELRTYPAHPLKMLPLLFEEIFREHVGLALEQSGFAGTDDQAFSCLCNRHICGKNGV